MQELSVIVRLLIILITIGLFTFSALFIIRAFRAFRSILNIESMFAKYLEERVAKNSIGVNNE